MRLIYKELLLVGCKGRRKVEALCDTGATHSLLREDIARVLGEPEELPEPKRFTAAFSEFVARLGLCVDVVVRGNRLMTLFVVCPGLTEEAILGADFFQMWHVRLSPRTRRWHLNPKALQLRAGSGRHRGSPYRAL